MNIENILFQVSVWTLPVLIAVTLHEAAHGWVAWKLGDDTAYRLGRVTFNPLRHIDPFGTILLPAMLLLASGGSVMFGAAKPVPVNFRGLRRPRSSTSCPYFRPTSANGSAIISRTPSGSMSCYASST